MNTRKLLLVSTFNVVIFWNKNIRIATHTYCLIQIFSAKKSEKINFHDKTGSVYPIPVLHVPDRTCKTEHSAPLHLLDKVYNIDD